MSSSSKPPKLKRTRDELETENGDTSDSARHTLKKSKKAKDPLRNHLPEFEGSEENQDLPQLRKAILKKAKKRNSKCFLGFLFWRMTDFYASYRIPPASDRCVPTDSRIR